MLRLNTLDRYYSNIWVQLFESGYYSQKQRQRVGTRKCHVARRAPAGSKLLTTVSLQVLEREIVTGQGYLARFAPLLKHICSSPQLYPCHRIQNAAVLALCKFMLVSSSLCEDNIQLLFTLLEKSTDEKTRCNIMILLHDLIIRFVVVQFLDNLSFNSVISARPLNADIFTPMYSIIYNLYCPSGSQICW